VIAGWLWFRLLRNTGATLGLLSGHSQLIASLSLVVVALLALLAIRASAGGMAGVIAMGAVTGGASSNLIDRLRLGGVTDFIEIRFWPTDFNLADLAIRLGVVAFLLSLLLELRRARRRKSTA
jgi:signal peptidase II